MIPMKTLAALALLAGGTAFAALPDTEADTLASGSQVCWLQAQTGSHPSALTAWAAPGVEAEWVLRLRHLDGQSYESEQSGYVDGRSSGPSRLARLVLAPASATPTMSELMTRTAATTPGTTVIAGSDFGPASGDVLPVEAWLSLYDPGGALICETAEIRFDPNR